MGEVVYNELGITFNEMLDYLKHLEFFGGPEPEVNANTKVFAKRFAFNFGNIGSQSCSGSLNLDYSYKVSHINKLFDDNVEFIYSLVIDIVKQLYNGNWSIYVNPYRYAIAKEPMYTQERFKQRSNARFKASSEFMLQDFQNLMRSGIFKSASITLDEKADLIKFISDRLDLGLEQRHQARRRQEIRHTRY